MRIFTRLLFIVFIIFSGFAYSSLAWSQSPKADQPLKTAWEPWFPYEYLSNKSLQSTLTGLDIELVKQFAGEAQQHVQFQQLSGGKALEAVMKGDLDMMAGVNQTADLEPYVYFSKPYRLERDALFVLRAKDQNYSFSSAEEFISYVKLNHFRLGIRKGGIPASTVMNAFVQDPKNSQYLFQSKDDLENLELLLNHQIDGFIADRIAGSTLIWKARANKTVAEHYLNMQTSIHLIFSKKTVSPQVVAEFDKAIQIVKQETAYRDDFSWYVYPVLMMQATGADWFKILDLLGTISFSISGVLIAYTLNKSLLSAMLYAILPCLCGGILRDVIFGRKPVEALETPEYLLLICGIVFVGHFILYTSNRIMEYEVFKQKSRFLDKLVLHFKRYLEHALIVSDALGLATLAVSGVMISLMARAEPLWLWGPFFSFMTASFGTIIRDILSKNERLEDVVGELYSEVGIAWGLFLSIALLSNVNNIQPQLVQGLILFTVAGGFITRLLVHYLKVPNVYFR